MDQRPAAQAGIADQKMGIGIAREQHGLEKDQRH